MAVLHGDKYSSVPLEVHSGLITHLRHIPRQYQVRVVRYFVLYCTVSPFVLLPRPDPALPGGDRNSPCFSTTVHPPSNGIS